MAAVSILQCWQIESLLFFFLLFSFTYNRMCECIWWRLLWLLLLLSVCLVRTIIPHSTNKFLVFLNVNWCDKLVLIFPYNNFCFDLLNCDTPNFLVYCVAFRLPEIWNLHQEIVWSSKNKQKKNNRKAHN